MTLITRGAAGTPEWAGVRSSARRTVQNCIVADESHIFIQIDRLSDAITFLYHCKEPEIEVSVFSIVICLATRL